MDLRVVKTQNQIKEAFLKLRDRLTPDKIKVKDICETAQINKTTFYKHYSDTAQLAHEIADSALDTVVSDFSERDKLFENPKAYITGLLDALKRQADNLKRIFRDESEVLCIKLSGKLRDFYKDMIKSLEDSIRLSFAIDGCVRVANYHVLTGKCQNIDEVSECTTHMIETIQNTKI